jgi:TPR repeat protein
VKLRIASLFAGLTLWLALFGAAAADQLTGGEAAYNRGDYATAMRLLGPIAEQGNDAAQFALATMYLNGQGVVQDNEQAARWLRRAADQGDAAAQYLLGHMYALGMGGPQNYVQAQLWIEKAADQGYADAQVSLGDIYYEGTGGVSQDFERAATWFRKAAEQGTPMRNSILVRCTFPDKACRRTIYRRSTGTARQPNKGTALLSSALG